MIVRFKDPDLEAIYQGHKVKKGRYKSLCKNDKLVNGYRRAVETMAQSEKTDDLKDISYLHYEKLKYMNKSSIRILNGSVERLIFNETEDGYEVELIEINDKHYGKKR